MKALPHIFAVVAMCFALVGCGMNFAQRLPQGGHPTKDSAVVIYGLRIEGNQSSFSMTLDAFDPVTSAANGNCFRWDRMQASILAGSTKAHYFAFQVPPGHYVYGVQQRPLKGKLLAFHATPGSTVLIGEFVLTSSNEVELLHNLEKERPAVIAMLPQVAREFSLAQSTPTEGVRLFMCTP